MQKHKAYYNENDQKCCNWLQSLMDQGLIMAGTIDNRSIHDVRPDDLLGYTRVGFFSGIGGWDLALQLAGWPEDRPVWHGSCPCQPFSTAGKGLAQADERHLWPVFFNLIKECRPEYVFGEQVASAIGKGWLDGISTDLGKEGYTCGSAVLGAHSVGAPHIRQRLYWVAYNPSAGLEGATRQELQRNGGGLARCSEVDGLAQPSDNGAGGDPREAGGCGRQSVDTWTESLRQAHGETGSSWADSRSASSASGLGNTIDTGLQGHGRLIQQHDEKGWEGTERHSATAGFWDDSIGTNCRDNKTRRIPAQAIIEPKFLLLVDGFYYTLASVLAELSSQAKQQIKEYAEITRTSPSEVLRMVQCTFSQNPLWSDITQTVREAGGLVSIQEEEVLFHSLRNLLATPKQPTIDGGSESEAGAKIHRRVLRDLQIAVKTEHSSLRWEPDEQQNGESSDALLELSQFLARCVKASESFHRRADAVAFPLSLKTEGRIPLLKGIGNAIVPQVAAEFIAASIEAIAT